MVDHKWRIFEIKVIIHASIDVLPRLSTDSANDNAIIMQICFSFIHDNDVDNLNTITFKKHLNCTWNSTS